MAQDLHNLEESLRMFLLDSQSDHYNAPNINLAKYNNLKISVDTFQYSIPHIIIRLGISEAVYSVENNERLSGGLGGDERLVRRWLERPYIKSELLAVWTEEKKVKIVTMKEDID